MMYEFYKVLSMSANIKFASKILKKRHLNVPTYDFSSRCGYKK